MNYVYVEKHELLNKYMIYISLEYVYRDWLCGLVRLWPMGVIAIYIVVVISLSILDDDDFAF